MPIHARLLVNYFDFETGSTRQDDFFAYTLVILFQIFQLSQKTASASTKILHTLLLDFIIHLKLNLGRKNPFFTLCVRQLFNSFDTS
jgi:hypothetical protein